jgi:tetratricopeptide (TPR) repeat protein
LNVSIGHEKLGDRNKKLEALNLALRYNPKYSKALVRRGDHFAAQEEYMEAIRDYAEAAEYDTNGFNV